MKGESVMETQVIKVSRFFGKGICSACIFMLLSLILILPLNLWSQPVDNPWPMYRQNPQGTAKSPYTGTDNPVVKWDFWTYYSFRTPALAKDGTVYSSMEFTPLYALDPRGDAIWVTNFNQSGDATRHVPSLDSSGTLYFCGSGSFGVDTLYAIDPGDGHKIWQLDIGGGHMTAPVIGSDGMIYVQGGDNLYAIQPGGNILWKSSDLPHFENHCFRNEPCFTLSPDETTIYAFVGARVTWLNPYFSAIEAASGDTLWSSPLYIKQFAVGDNGTIYGVHVRNFPDPAQLVALSPVDGEKKWGLNIQKYDLSWNVNLPAIDGNNIYVASWDTLYAITDGGSLGTMKWKRKMASTITTPPVVDAAGTIYVVLQNDGVLCAIDSANGDIKWQRNACDGIETPPVIDEDGTIYVGHNLGVYAIGPWMAGYWDFNDGSGSTLTEMTGNAVDGIIHDATWVDNGLCGYSLYFDGTGDFVEIPFIPSLTPQSEITIEFWFQIESPGDSTILSCGSDKDAWGGYMFYFESDSLVWYLNVNHSHVKISKEDIALKQWHFLAGVYDGTSMKIYLNGTLKNEKDVSGPIISYATSLILGASCVNRPGTDPRGYHYKGYLDELRIYNYALSLTEIIADGNLCEPTSVAGEHIICNHFDLNQNYPNPFNPETKISYSLPNSCFVTLKVYDMLGKEVQTLVNKFQNANTYSVNFNAGKLASGIYFYKLQTEDGYSNVKKMIIIK